MRIPSQYVGVQRENGVMTPMIDVVFQLLIFFVVASTGQVAEALLPTQLPAHGAVSNVQQQSERETWADEVFVALSRDGRDHTVANLNGTIYDDLSRLTGVLGALAEVSRINPIILKIDEAVPLEDVIYVYDACRKAGFESINFAADPDAIPAPPG